MRSIHAFVVAAVLVTSMAITTTASARCVGKETASGAPEKDISNATANAYAALENKIRSDYGDSHRIGSRRSAKYTCTKHMGGQPKYIKWKCSLRAEVCTTNQQPDPSSEYIARQKNRYVKGEGYDTFKTNGWNSCSSACLNDDQCNVVEFHRPTNKCNLFDGSPRIKRDSNSDSVVGIKKH